MSFIIVVLGMLLYGARADLFTAIVDLERLLEAEQLVANDLRQYVAQEQERLQRLSR